METCRQLYDAADGPDQHRHEKERPRRIGENHDDRVRARWGDEAFQLAT